MSFFELFSKKNYWIVIPIIQRDYAQGRKSTEEVRNTFLDALFKYLEDNIPNRDLDFIYGSLNDSKGVINFIPLDGQQRLTTLFLLHWYLYQISDNFEKKHKFKETLLIDNSSRFTYETRSSSAEFCNALMNNVIDFYNLLEPDKDLEGRSKLNSLSKTIKNCSWFFLSWQFDPTIQSMLRMLDAIHQKFNNRKIFFDRLITTENPIITFLLLNLEDFKLTDDLYIKMNSRGKPLSPFENFKAKFEQYLEDIRTDRKFYLDFDKNTVSLKKYFSHNIDTKWANLFWNYRTLQNRSNSKKDEDFDDEMMNFFRVIFSNQYAINAGVSLKDKDNSLEYLLGTNVAKKNKDYSDIISFNKYKELKALSINSALYLVDALDSFINGHKKIKTHLLRDYEFYFNEKLAFKNALKHNFESNHQRLCFHAYTRYLILNKKDNINGINQWMRVIHNLTHPENTIIDNASQVANAIETIELLIPYSTSILDYLKLNPDIKFFSSWQVLEEIVKSHLIKKNDIWKNKIETIEKHKYFNGQIGFILEFAGIMEYYKMNKNCDWDSIEDEEYFRKLSEYAGKAGKVFENNYENRINNKDYVFERAVLTKGDYLTQASQYRRNLLSTNLVKNNIKRDHSWKRLLRIIEDNEWTSRRLFVKEVFDDIRFDKNNLEYSLNLICEDKTGTWRDHIITCPDIINYCKQGFIRVESENNILLYGESQSNHMHAEMYSFYLWKKYFETKESSFYPFKNIIYKQVKSIEEKAYIVLGNFCKNKINYEVDVYYCNNLNQPNCYKVIFKISHGENFPERYGNGIKQILELFDFEWKEEYKGYFYISNGGSNVVDKLKQITLKLKETD